MRGAGGVKSDTLTYSMPGLAFATGGDFGRFRYRAVEAIRNNVKELIEPCLNIKKKADSYLQFVHVDVQPAARLHDDKSIAAVVMDIQPAELNPDKASSPFVVNIPMPDRESIERAKVQKKLAEAFSIRNFKRLGFEIQHIMEQRSTNGGVYNDVWVVGDSVYLKSKLRESPSPEVIDEYKKETIIKFVYTCYMYSICNFFVSIDDSPVYNFIAKPQGLFRTRDESFVVKVENVGMDLATFLQQKSGEDMVDHSLIAEVLLQVNLVLYYAFVLLNLVHGDLHTKNICVKKEKCTMLVPGTQERLEFSHKVYLIDFDWACFKSGDHKNIFPDAATKFFLKDKCITFNQDFLLVNTSSTLSPEELRHTENAMERAHKLNPGDAMTKYKLQNVKYIILLNRLFRQLYTQFYRVYHRRQDKQTKYFLNHFSHLFFSIPKKAFLNNSILRDPYKEIMIYSNFLGKYITKVFPPKMREVGGKRRGNRRGDNPPGLQEKRAKMAAQVLLTQAFSGLTF